MEATKIQAGAIYFLPGSPKKDTFAFSRIRAKKRPPTADVQAGQKKKDRDPGNSREGFGGSIFGSFLNSMVQLPWGAMLMSKGTMDR